MSPQSRGTATVALQPEATASHDAPHGQEAGGQILRVTRRLPQSQPRPRNSEGWMWAALLGSEGGNGGSRGGRDSDDFS